MIEFQAKTEMGEEVRLVRWVKPSGKRGAWVRATPEAIAKAEARGAEG